MRHARLPRANCCAAAGGMWLIGVQIAAPILLATMLIDVTVGFLSKASPQLPAMFIGISAKSLIGLRLAGCVRGAVARLLEKQISRMRWDGRSTSLRSGALSRKRHGRQPIRESNQHGGSRRRAKRARWCAPAILCLALTLLAVIVGAFLAAADLDRAAGAVYSSGLLDAGSSGEIGLGTPIFSWTALAVAQWVAPVLMLALAVSLALGHRPGRIRLCRRSAQAQLGPPESREQSSARFFRLPGLSRLLRSLVPFAAHRVSWP